jgi:hypothetical protein
MAQRCQNRKQRSCYPRAPSRPADPGLILSLLLFIQVRYPVLVLIEDWLLLIHLFLRGLFAVTAGHFETWLCFGVTPVGRSLPDYDAVAACRFRKMTSGSTLAVSIAFVDMLVSGFSIRVIDLVG